jgi:hypothetical protein
MKEIGSYSLDDRRWQQSHPGHASCPISTPSRLTFSSANTRPKIICPVEWPNPQSAPSAAAAMRPLPMESGASPCETK